MEDQKNEIRKGGTMRLGAYPCSVRPGTRLHECYGRELVDERHRHRYEFNNIYRSEFENAGMLISGTSPDKTLVEAVELTDHPFYVGVQYHPEFLSRPNRAHPLFKGLVKASITRKHENAAVK